jgi:hypothetical protein
MKALLSLTIAGLLMLLVGCATSLPAKVDQGGFLKPNDYAALQDTISHLPPHPTGYLKDLADKPWSPTWIYYAENVRFDNYDTISIPDLEQPAHVKSDLVKEIPDAIQKQLLDRKLFQRVLRESPNSGLALIGSLTREKEGSVARSIISADSNIIQVEFKIMEGDRQIGAIQAYAWNTVPMGIAAAIARGIEGSLEDQIANRVANSFEGLRSGKYRNSANGKQNQRDWIVPALISK